MTTPMYILPQKKKKNTQNVKCLNKQIRLRYHVVHKVRKSEAILGEGWWLEQSLSLGLSLTNCKMKESISLDGLKRPRGFSEQTCSLVS